jgi:hypothetical protein
MNRPGIRCWFDRGGALVGTRGRGYHHPLGAGIAHHNDLGPGPVGRLLRLGLRGTRPGRNGENAFVGSGAGGHLGLGDIGRLGRGHGYCGAAGVGPLDIFYKGLDFRMAGTPWDLDTRPGPAL